jgi:hypothetical protein
LIPVPAAAGAHRYCRISPTLHAIPVVMSDKAGGVAGYLPGTAYLMNRI